MNQKPWYLSRKIWVAVVDAVVSIALACVAYFLRADAEFAKLLTVVIVSLQGPAMAVIGAIAWEDNNVRNNAPYTPETPEVR